MKDFQLWKEAPLDTLVLALYQLQVYYANEVRRGFAGLGQYHLAETYESIKIDAQDVEYIRACTPDEIVHNIKERSGEQSEKHERKDKSCSERSEQAEDVHKKYHSPSMHKQLPWLKMIKLLSIQECTYSTSKAHLVSQE